MKRWLYATSLCMMLAASANAESAYKIATVKVSSIFQQLSQREMLSKQLEKEFNGRAIDLQKQETALQSKMQKLQHDSSIMQDNDRANMEKEIMAQRDAFLQKAQAFEEDNRRRQTEENNKLLIRIKDAVSIVAKNKGYDLVIDANAVAYSSALNDITAQVLKQVQ
ncbi:OmpH family outer membrane protein [Candidatus Profftia tarda]|uniref:OmpH family outer membrane protein n=1 Tax=Candidatus Profftia tarda TaxID=1177216 RepID=UPI001C1FCBD6|nr:OmpH family outer membrane protein [Candidatus Profftia tarda]